MKDKGASFEKPLNMNIHYSQTLVLKKDFFENNLHTLPFYTGPKDMEDPVVHETNSTNLTTVCILVLPFYPWSYIGRLKWSYEKVCSWLRTRLLSNYFGIAQSCQFATISYKSWSDLKLGQIGLFCFIKDGNSYENLTVISFKYSNPRFSYTFPFQVLCIALLGIFWWH